MCEQVFSPKQSKVSFRLETHKIVIRAFLDISAHTWKEEGSHGFVRIDRIHYEERSIIKVLFDFVSEPNANECIHTTASIQTRRLFRVHSHCLS